MNNLSFLEFHTKQKPEHIDSPYKQLIYCHYHYKRRRCNDQVFESQIDVPLDNEVTYYQQYSLVKYIKRQYSFVAVIQEFIPEV